MDAWGVACIPFFLVAWFIYELHLVTFWVAVPTIFRGGFVPPVLPSPLFSTPILVLQQHNERGGQFPSSLSPLFL
jgi:hypothetical protein